MKKSRIILLILVIVTSGLATGVYYSPKVSDSFKKSFGDTQGSLDVFKQVGNSIIPRTSTRDFGIGGTATTSADFVVDAGNNTIQLSQFTNCNLDTDGSGFLVCGTDATGGGGGGSFGGIELIDSGSTFGTHYGSISFDAGHFTSTFGSPTASASILRLDWGAGGPASLSEAETITGNWVNTANPWDVSTETNLTAGTDLTLTNDDLTLDSTLTQAYSFTNVGSQSMTGSLNVAKGFTANSYQGGGLAECNDAGDTLNYANGQFTCGSDGGGISFGTDNQIPFTNSGGTDFDYSANLTFDGSLLSIIGAASVSTNFEVDGYASVGGNMTVLGSLNINNGRAEFSSFTLDLKNTTLTNSTANNGGAVYVNDNFTVANTTALNGTANIGDNGDAVTINSSTWDVTAGVFTGIVTASISTGLEIAAYTSVSGAFTQNTRASNSFTGDLSVSDDILLGDDILLNNGNWFQMKDAAGTPTNLLRINSSNDAHFLPDLTTAVDSAYLGFNSPIPFTIGGSCCGGSPPTTLNIDISGTYSLIIDGGTKFAISGASPYTITGAVPWDLGSATSFELPNSTSPTVDAEGEIAWHTSSDSLDVYDASNTRVFNSKECHTAFVESPTSSNNRWMDVWGFDNPFVITEVYLVNASGSNSAGWNLYYGSPSTIRTGAGSATKVFTTDRSASTSLNTEMIKYTNFANSTITDGDILNVHISSPSATLEKFSFKFCGRNSH